MLRNVPAQVVLRSFLKPKKPKENGNENSIESNDKERTTGMMTKSALLSFENDDCYTSQRAYSECLGMFRPQPHVGPPLVVPQQRVVVPAKTPKKPSRRAALNSGDMDVGTTAEVDELFRIDEDDEVEFQEQWLSEMPASADIDEDDTWLEVESVATVSSLEVETESVGTDDWVNLATLEKLSFRDVCVRGGPPPPPEPKKRPPPPPPKALRRTTQIDYYDEQFDEVMDYTRKFVKRSRRSRQSALTRQNRIEQKLLQQPVPVPVSC